MKYSFESLTGDAGATGGDCANGIDLTGVDQASASSLAEALDISSDVQEMVIELGNDEASTEVIIRTMEDASNTEEAGEKMLKAAEAGEEPSAATMESINLMMSRLLPGGRVSISTESFAPGRNRSASYKAAAEGIIDSAKDVIKRAIEWIKKMVAKAVEWFTAKFGSATRLQSAYEKLIKRLNENSKKVISTETEIPARRFHLLVSENGSKVSGDIDVRTVLKNAEKGFKDGKDLIDGCKSYVENVTKVFDALAKATNAKDTRDDVIAAKKAAFASLEKSATAFTFSVKGDGETGTISIGDGIKKDEISADSNIIVKNKMVVGDLVQTAKAGQAHALDLRVIQILSATMKKEAEKAIKQIEAAQKKMDATAKSTVNGQDVPARIAKMVATESTKMISESIRTVQSASVKVNMSGSAMVLSFLATLSTKTEKADD